MIPLIFFRELKNRRFDQIIRMKEQKQINLNFMFVFISN